LPGPDHKSSLTPSELNETIQNVKKTEIILGEYVKRPNKEELKVAKIARKKIIAKKNIEKGEFFTYLNLTTKRAYKGKSAINFWKVIGTKSKKKYKADDII
jgi:N,N'-diacetyllegionaminate synthase